MLALALAIAPSQHLLPPAPPAPPGDAAYRARVQECAARDSWPWTTLEELRPGTPQQAAALVELLDAGDVRTVRLCAVLASGTAASEPLGHALLAAALRHPREDEALACLLAVGAVEDAHLPALAELALDPLQPLSVRAAACGRLLEAGCSSAWPLARSVLRTGTALDERAPWADWQRSGRYELPKRILLGSVQRWLRAHDRETTDFEPNASWGAQERALARLEERVAPWWQRADPRTGAPPETWQRLLARAGDGDRRAARALALLRTRTSAFLVKALADDDRRRRLGARWALQSVLH